MAPNKPTILLATELFKESLHLFGQQQIKKDQILHLKLIPTLQINNYSFIILLPHNIINKYTKLSFIYLTFQIAQLILKMGVTQTFENADFLFTSYEIVSSDNELKILIDKKTKAQLILKQQSFVNKTEYDHHFKIIREKQKQSRQSQNILKMIKLWSKQHNGVCSNIFKIYTVYEYPKIRLIEEIEARKQESKYFEESQLMSILQSCLNAFLIEPLYLNISPSLIFILEEGVLKLANIDLLDANYQTVYHKDYYYSPQKISNFHQGNLTIQEKQKQSIFSIGMTILHAALLYNPSECYQISRKRFNKKKLQFLKGKMSAIYSETLSNLIKNLLQVDATKRINFHQLQSIVNELTSEHLSVNSFTQNEPIHQISNALETNLMNFGKDVVNSAQKQQVGSNLNSSQLTLNSFVNPVRKSQFQIIIDPLGRNSIRKQPRISEQTNNTHLNNNKENNIFTDVHIMKMIKQGIEKIEKNNKSRQLMKDKKLPPSQRSTKSVQLQPIISSKSDGCVYIVQQYDDQSRYEGMVQNGVKNGFGKLIYHDGVFYQGNFKNDTLCGKGSLYYGINRPAYVGEWYDNKFNGYGTLYNQYSTLIDCPFDYGDFNKINDHWIKFEGYFKDDAKEGTGKIILTNGETIQAMFNCGVINGEGVFSDLNGNKIRGVWQNNKLKNLIQ